MHYNSTRSSGIRESFKQIIFDGMAPDGGLFIPEIYPKISGNTLNEWRNLRYHQLSAKIISLFAPDIGFDEIAEISERVYRPEIFPNVRVQDGIDSSEKASQITPLTWISEEMAIVELSNGPTLAFKDLAMQMLGAIFAHVLGDKRINILGATSGDTGSSAEYAFKNYENINVFMLSPKRNMSDFQRAQMYSLQDENIFNLVFDGVFDQAQDLVKELNADLSFKKRYSICAVNSINFARIAAQIVYYFNAYFRATDSFESIDDQWVDFSIPSGNFGNAYSGHVAKQMGLPIRRLIVATNENEVLHNFFQTGIYRPRAASEVHVTSSPSMDIAKASNLERFISDLFNRDSNRIKDLWDRISKKSKFDISDTEEFRSIPQKYGFYSSTSTHIDRLDMIRKYYKNGFIIDPHTADAIFAAEKYSDGKSKVPVLVMETAKPDKFIHVMHEAGFKDYKINPKFAHLMKQAQKSFALNDDIFELKFFISKYSDH